jgi:ribose 1,5-bisphosphate isomerase
MIEQEVVAAFLEHEGKILILKRSTHPVSRRARWTVLWSYLRHEPFRQALQAIKEETGLAESDVSLVRAGDPMEVDHRRAGVKWILYPFLFRVRDPRKIVSSEPGEQRKWVTRDGFRRARPQPWLVEALQKLTSPPEGKEPPEPVRKLVHRIAMDRVHGASYLTEQALRAFEILAGASAASGRDEFLAEFRGTVIELAFCRTGISSIANAVSRLATHWTKALKKNTSPAEMRRQLVSLSRGYQDRLEESRLNAAREAALRVEADSTLLTMSLSSSFLAFAEALPQKRINVIVAESRPQMEGRETARVLAKMGIPVTLITDAEIGHFAWFADSVLVGADSILPDGSVVNKIGTRLMALAARDAGIPFIVISDTWKIHICGSFAPEEKGPSEVMKNPPEGVRVRNIYFDVTPPELVSRFVTEKGTFTAAGIRRIRDRLLSSVPDFLKQKL